MALVPQSFIFENIKLNFFSFIHPETQEMWVDGVSVAKSLGYKDHRRALFDNVQNITFKCKWSDLIKGVVTTTTPSNWQQNTTMINRAGWISLILSSKQSNALKIRDWVCATVIPSIIDTGKYELGQEYSNNNLKIKLLEQENQLLKKDNKIIQLQRV